jgi:hypothetical protein
VTQSTDELEHELRSRKPKTPAMRSAYAELESARAAGRPRDRELERAFRRFASAAAALLKQ